MEVKSSLNIPMSIKEDSLGIPLDINVKDGFITNIKIAIKGVNVNFLTVIRESASYLKRSHKDRIENFDDQFKFYSLIDGKGKFILAIKQTNNIVEKIRYS